MVKYTNITLGADPELFLMNPNDGGFVSAHKYIRGTKEKPFPVDKGAIQLDGTAAEFNIYPCSTVNQWVDNISTVMGRLREEIKDTGYVLSASPVADFDPVYFDQSVPASAKKLGCDPDYNAWEMCPNETPDVTRTFRTGAGHVHIGWGHNFDPMDPNHFEECAEVARQLDYYLGIYSLVWDQDNRRRELYGKAGAFRPKPYGVEYRVLSNAWLKSEMLQRWVFAAIVSAMEDLSCGLKYESFHGDLARDIIDGNVVDWFNFPDAPEMDLPFPPGFSKKAA